MMDGRVKTLHPGLHGGILARRDRPDDLQAAETHGIGLVDLVVVNLYPFEQTAAKPGVTFDELVEEIDIGGPSMVRAAAKNFRDVLVVVEPAEYPRAARQRSTGRPDARVPLRAMRKAHGPHGAVRHGDCARRCTTSRVDGDAFVRASGRRASALRDRPGVLARQDARPAVRREPAPEGGAVPGLRRRRFGRGRTCCRARSCRTPTCWTSTRPCASRSSSASRQPWSSSTRTRAARRPATSAADAYVRARDADSLAAFGGIVAVNRPIDVADGRGDRVDVHRGGHRAVCREAARCRCWRARRTCAWWRRTSTSCARGDRRIAVDAGACSCRSGTA